MYIIAGLGNPGSKYHMTRHNAGFMVIDKLAENNNIDMGKLKHRAFIGDGTIGGKRAMLLKPQTFMNLSGESVREAMAFYKADISELIVIFDDTSIPAGTVRIREKGSAGGHNGMKSIISCTGTTEFKRVRIGIGEKPSGWDLADYVLGKFSADDAILVQSAAERAAEAIEILVSDGIQAAMNKAHVKP